jgi:hypothetical protein
MPNVEGVSLDNAASELVTCKILYNEDRFYCFGSASKSNLRSFKSSKWIQGGPSRSKSKLK